MVRDRWRDVIILISCIYVVSFRLLVEQILFLGLNHFCNVYNWRSGRVWGEFNIDVNEIDLCYWQKKVYFQEEIDEMSDVFVKTLNYTRRMARFKNRETIRAVRT